MNGHKDGLNYEGTVLDLLIVGLLFGFVIVVFMEIVCQEPPQEPLLKSPNHSEHTQPEFR